MSGDTIVIGAPYSGSSGAAYVFKYDGAEWVQVNKTSPQTTPLITRISETPFPSMETGFSSELPAMMSMRAQPTSSLTMVPTGYRPQSSPQKGTPLLMRSLETPFPSVGIRSPSEHLLMMRLCGFSLCFQV